MKTKKKQLLTIRTNRENGPRIGPKHHGLRAIYIYICFPGALGIVNWPRWTKILSTQRRRSVLRTNTRETLTVVNNATFDNTRGTMKKGGAMARGTYIHYLPRHAHTRSSIYVHYTTTRCTLIRAYSRRVAAIYDYDRPEFVRPFISHRCILSRSSPTSVLVYYINYIEIAKGRQSGYPFNIRTPCVLDYFDDRRRHTRAPSKLGTRKSYGRSRTVRRKTGGLLNRVLYATISAPVESERLPVERLRNSETKA